MERLLAFTQTLQEINNTTKDIINEAYPILKELESDENDLINDFMEEFELNRRDSILVLAREFALSLVSDARAIQKEIDEFSDLITERNIEQLAEYCPFLAEVWFGDMYECDGVEGLKILLSDLEEQLENINEDTVYNYLKQTFVEE